MSQASVVLEEHLDNLEWLKRRIREVEGVLSRRRQVICKCREFFNALDKVQYADSFDNPCAPLLVAPICLYVCIWKILVICRVM